LIAYLFRALQAKALIQRRRTRGSPDLFARWPNLLTKSNDGLRKAIEWILRELSDQNPKYRKLKWSKFRHSV